MRQTSGENQPAREKHETRLRAQPGLVFFGGGKEIRTPDLLNAIQTLYQLSYTPTQSQLAPRSLPIAPRITALEPDLHSLRQVPQRLLVGGRAWKGDHTVKRFSGSSEQPTKSTAVD